MGAVSRTARLIPGISQYEVDFVIPRLGIDLPVGIDPFLLFKSRSDELRQLHSNLLAIFNDGISHIRRGALDRARQVFDFPEVSEIGFGYTRSGKRGSGVGTYLKELIVSTLSSSPSLLERGIHHVEEMQLFSTGIGPDRISDIAGNLLKQYLIEYTQRQCSIWKLPIISGVPIAHVYNRSSQTWEDLYEDLPVTPIDGTPILLVPRRIVRVLPWINYDDFLRTEFVSYLSARRKSSRLAGNGAETTEKTDVVTITRSNVALVDRYIRSREQRAAEARPAVNYIDEDSCREANSLKEQLRAVPSGREHSHVYQHTVLEILNYLFNPELIDGTPEVATVEGTERRDIIFTNDSDESFWGYLRTEHGSIVVMFETKNTESLDLSAVNQTATYLGDRLGRFGVIVTRQQPSDAVRRKLFSVWNDSAPNRKVILVLTDANLQQLLDLRCAERSTTKWMQKHYRQFRTSVQ